VQTASLLSPEVDAGELPPIGDDVIKVGVLEEGLKGRAQLEEHFAMMGVRRTARLQIVNQRLADFFGHWQTERREGLRLRNL
jgi:hypothetical protein